MHQEIIKNKKSSTSVEASPQGYLLIAKKKFALYVTAQVQLK